MATRTRPSSCCGIPLEPAPLPGPEQERLAALFRALADPTRLAVFRLVAAQREPICACDVVDRFDVGQPTVSHHLRVLRDAGLVRVSRQGVWAFYAPDPDGLALLGRAGALLAGEEVSAVA